VSGRYIGLGRGSAVREDGMKALALVEARNHVCCRYRVRAFEATLAVSGWSLEIEPLATGLLHRLYQFRRAARFDAVLLQRKLLPGWQLHELRKRARRLIFDFDDAVLYRDSYDRRGPHHRRRSDRFQRTVQVADTVIAGNDFLADCALKAGAHPDKVRVIPTCIDADRARPSAEPKRGPGLDLVWIGSASTMAGLAQQRPLWERIGREVPGVRLRMVCDHFLRFESLPVVDIPWSESTEAVDVASADVGISWVPDDLWSRGKCGLKVLQYQAAGLPVVANPVGVHPKMIHSGVDGFLATTADEWVEAIHKLAADPDLRHQMGQMARSSLETEYSVQSWAPAFVAAIAGARPLASLEPSSSQTSKTPKSIVTREHRPRGEVLPPPQQYLTSS
jgi:glycosyltransferase involved in cell wall biosynthesis